MRWGNNSQDSALDGVTESGGEGGIRSEPTDLDSMDAFDPQGSPQKRPMVVTSKPANGMWPGTRLFYSDASCGGKSVFVRQLRGPHLSTWPWWRRRSSIAVTAALSPSSLPQSSTGRLEVSKVLARS